MVSLDEGNLRVSWEALSSGLGRSDTDLGLEMSLEVGPGYTYSAWPEVKAQHRVDMFSGLKVLCLPLLLTHNDANETKKNHETKYLHSEKCSSLRHLLPFFPGKHLLKLPWGAKFFGKKQLNTSFSAYASCLNGSDGKISHTPLL